MARGSFTRPAKLGSFASHRRTVRSVTAAAAAATFALRPAAYHSLGRIRRPMAGHFSILQMSADVMVFRE
jgi:hypothetical protein